MKTNDIFNNHFMAALKEATDKITDEEITAAQKRVEQRVRERVAQTAVAIARHSVVDYSCDEIVIRVKFDGHVET